ncbi:hypothetical protein Ccrd_017304 [Cynara cardunculus var. scolymus]|uniref:Uncharacterized protein n=1 Tax=Cynara cardunculus var. scolymus TaxID=59895 RepID=A0A124SFU7_CYNCS|nr:hypothetical protein Ccrd_017304 [Cynara cardunculus var. scolymus]
MMKSTSTTPRSLSLTQFCSLRRTHFLSISRASPSFPRFFSVGCNSCTPPLTSVNNEVPQDILIAKDDVAIENFGVEVRNPKLPSFVLPARLSLGDQAFFLLTFIACTASIAFTGFVMAAVPTLYAMGRAAISLAKLADTAREELPSTMAAIRLSGMEISDLTLELSDLSQEISDGVNKSAQAVQAAEAGERASLPVISIQPVVAGVAKKTSHAVGQAGKSFMNMISGGDSSPEDEKAGSIDTLDI